MKNSASMILAVLMTTAGLRYVNAQTTNIMPQGFEGVSLGMTSNQLAEVRSGVHEPDTDFPVSLMELLPDDNFFDGVYYHFFPNGTLSDVHFIAGTFQEETRKKVAAGLVKGCIQKYGTNYEQRVVNVTSSSVSPLAKLALLRWTNESAIVVASFISEPNRTAYRQANADEIRYLPYKLRIYHPDAVSIKGGTNNLMDISLSYPPNQDTTGQAFTNFPAFLDSYSGPIWE